MKGKVVVRSLSTNGPHPNAIYATLPMKLRHSAYFDKWKIIGSFLVIIVKGQGGDHLEVWNWKTGEECLVSATAQGCKQFYDIQLTLSYSANERLQASTCSQKT